MTPQSLRSRVYGRRWRLVRELVLRRDGLMCQVRLAGCQIAASTVDHIVPWREGGSWWEESNLRAACVSCNQLRSAETRRRRSRHSSREW